MSYLKNHYFEIIACLLTALSVFYFDGQSNELCWGLWISSLLTGWVVILPSVLRILSLRSLILLGLIIVFALNGCDVVWNLGNQGALKRDIKELLKTHGITIKDPHCNMIGTSRSAICDLELTPKQVALVVKGLNLKELTLESSSGENPWIKLPEPKEGCLSSKFFQGAKQVKVYLSKGRPPELRLKSGRAFEYFILFQDLETEKICIQISYAYG